MLFTGPSPAPPIGTSPRTDEIATFALAGLAGDTGWRRPVIVERELLILTTRGHGDAELDFHPLPCRPGTLLRVRPGQVLRCVGPQFDATVVAWDPHALRDVDLDLATAVTWRQLAGEDEDAVINEVSQLVVDCQRHPDGPTARALLRHQLAVLLLRLALAQADRSPARPEEETFHRFHREVEHGYPHTRRVEDYAAGLGCSVRTLTRACLAVTGRSAKQVIDERVALQAARLLAATDQPIAQIGRHLGFSEPTNFGRFFTREVGVSPGAFRAARDQPAGNRVVRQRPPAEPTGANGGRFRSGTVETTNGGHTARPGPPAARPGGPGRA
ncbi:AraC family transcriptional regulator [Micromonospora sp. WMMD1120]|uniref:helix-turn-helix transcriptional regulator n=1 Tax=Micromonospora sp. WMMD1120 TaxID=3016106 RepID=UPI0024160E74|nr:AraC family transcriptional regulator [Micromonospora sp. WMMD1120]MDG4808701.1 AraC family transcriptional regulator [Micromonospora sp. WMMD1120]